MSWIAAGRAVDTALPTDRLSDAEFAELRRLVIARESLAEQALLLEHRMELLLLAARDGRGLQGRIQVNHQTGALRCAVDPEEGAHARLR